MSFKIGCDISGEVVMTKIQWVQYLIQGCDVMREVDGKGRWGKRGLVGRAGTWFQPKGQAETWSVLSGVGAGEALGGLAAMEELCLHAGNNPPSARVGHPSRS